MTLRNQDWGLLSPELVSDSINFEGRNPDWQYASDNRESMAAKQTEGVAYLWNLLSSNGVALLADEVGMGKTFQALGVAALLWKMKPGSKVLVMAPNREICRHWRREFETFVHRHYRETDHCVRNFVDGGPIPSVRMCFKLDELVENVEQGAGHLFLTTITSLSGLVKGEDKREGDLPAKARRAAKKIRRRLKTVLGDDGFDLVIVDEAHYLRNLDGGSQRVAAAKALFGEEGDRLGNHNLLLTATPSHTRLSNVQGILSYFVDLQDVDPHGKMNEPELARALLQRYALRRLRLMEGAGGLHSKLHYRHEKPLASDFEGRPNGEMFFALYQKRLVSDLKKQKEGRSLMYGYLEGFESMGRRPEGDVGKSDGSEGDIEDAYKEDFSKAKDTELLKRLTQDYFDTLNDFPDHPKYGEIVGQCLPVTFYEDKKCLTDDKHLIFVRRIPSVRELTQRVNAGYDRLLASQIVQAWGLEWNDERVQTWGRQQWSREGFKSLLSGLDQDIELEEAYLEDEGGSEVTDDNDYLSSRIAELFVVKKELGGQTDCANVRLRFVKPESLFSLFLEPSSDYLDAGYHAFYLQDGSRRADYGNAAMFTRISAWGSSVALKSALGSREPPSAQYENELKTVWALVYPLLNAESRSKLESWAKNDREVAENFANYIKAGMLYASPVIVELYCWFVQFRLQKMGRKERDVQRAYRHFVKWVTPKLPGSLLLKYFESALSTFETLCGKIVDHGLREWQRDWTSLKRLTSPAWYASGENSEGRQRLILGFNTPFYPNVLVSTSVLQEGVNLHIQCYQVHHYGLAGSPGDNEQRVGRLDRLFGCVNQRLKSATNRDLQIYYPYLQRSIDEDQVGSFIERKHRVEEQMDDCLQVGFDKRVHYSSVENWKQFLRTPKNRDDAPVNDPYPAKFSDSCAVTYRPYAVHDNDQIFNWLERLVKRVVNPDTDFFQVIDEAGDTRHTLYLVDPKIARDGVHRHQPIFVNLEFSSELSALIPDTAYLVSLVSPIANKPGMARFLNHSDGRFGKLEEKIAALNEQYALPKLTLDEKSDNSYLYLAARIDLPLFVKEGTLQHLSLHEVQMAFDQLKAFSDELELFIHDGAQDLEPGEASSTGHFMASGFRDGGHSKVGSGKRLEWHENGQTVGLSVGLEADALTLVRNRLDLTDIPADSLMAGLVLNQHFPMVRFSQYEEGIDVGLNYPAGDLQDEETRLMELWFEYVVSGLQ
ncbi:DEAD/DEAH box helicase [Alcanivorax sp.]|uniref:DEAD/DEAH box helicase n=1 Tax=Alcanivorax sp. TaxID=1872427 RepID=UPI0025B7B17C|nr:DEAD/DEAH box helicase [Alcanivorax sp.]